MFTFHCKNFSLWFLQTQGLILFVHLFIFSAQIDIFVNNINCVTKTNIVLTRAVEILFIWLDEILKLNYRKRQLLCRVGWRLVSVQLCDRRRNEVTDNALVRARAVGHVVGQTIFCKRKGWEINIADKSVTKIIAQLSEIIYVK